MGTPADQSRSARPAMIGSDARLLATVSAVAPLAEVLVDLLSGSEPLLFDSPQRCRSGRHAGFPGHPMRAEHLWQRVAELAACAATRDERRLARRA